MTQRFSLRQIFAVAPFWVLAGIILCAAWNGAAAGPVQHRRMENRFLIVVDTASAMKSRTNGIEEAVAGLIASDMKGELRPGDTIGLWTYSDTLSTDFPMQVWSEGKKQAIANDIGEHMRSLVYEKRSHLEKAWPAIHQAVTTSERLTVILIFDGSDVIKGTSFDKDINNLLKHYARQFRSAHEPIVTVLAARNGAIFDYTINHPSSVMVPHLADPVPPSEPLEAAPVAVTPPPPEIVTPPAHRVEINVSGADFPHTARTPPPIVSNVAEAPSPPVAAAPLPVQAAPVATQTAPAAPTVNTTVAPPETAPVPNPASAPAAIPLAPATPPAALASVIPPAASPSRPVAMLVMAFSLLIIAVALVVLLIWRWRGRSQPSLISRSIDRPQ